MLELERNRGELASVLALWRREVEALQALRLSEEARLLEESRHREAVLQRTAILFLSQDSLLLRATFGNWKEVANERNPGLRLPPFLNINRGGR